MLMVVHLEDLAAAVSAADLMVKLQFDPAARREGFLFEATFFSQ